MLQLWFFANTLLWPYNLDIGGLKLGLNVAVLTAVGLLWIGTRQRISTSSINIFFCLFVILLISFAQALTGVCTDKFSKFIATAPVFLILVFLSVEVGTLATSNDWLKLQITAIYILTISFVAFLFESLFPAYFPIQAGYRLDGKYSGLFNEPSHVAFTLFPLICILMASEVKKFRLIGIIFLFCYFLLSRSSTLLALITLWMIYRLISSRRPIYVILFFSAILIVTVGSLFYGYTDLNNPTFDRIIGVFSKESTDNISSLVYVQGWEDAWINLLRTNGMGLGFNMMGCNPLPYSPSRLILANAFELDANSDDGSFLASKLMSEVGIFGILFIYWAIRLFIRMESNNKKYMGIFTNSSLSIQIAVMFSILSTFFIRTSGYFSGGFFLLIATIAACFRWRRELLNIDPQYKILI